MMAAGCRVFFPFETGRRHPQSGRIRAGRAARSPQNLAMDTKERSSQHVSGIVHRHLPPFAGE
jgi:hypothetical protein